MDNLSNENSHEKMMAAHERFMARRRAFAERNPLAIPGEERRRLQLQADRGSLRAHEMNMLYKRNANSLAIAKENRGAAREQGMEAANAKARADIELGNINKGLKETELKNQLTMHEQQMANNLAVADKKGEIDKEIERIRASALKDKLDYEARQQRSKLDSNERIAAGRNQASVETAEIRSQGNRDKAKERIDRADLNMGKNKLSQFLNDPVNKRNWEKMTDEEKAAWFKERGLVDFRENGE